ncbi:MAG: alcohol dehydrogenase catalytic domain-containing protein [Clostridia bacterium]|nr:alcohol dehydrogenase catalytic domain-containing protein [Clostridia bacterium]
MESWILKGIKNLVNEPQSEAITSPTQVKVKVSHLLLTQFDELLYDGSLRVDYPKIPGRAAVGIVTEAGEGCYGIEKGMRVYLEPWRACGECLPCKSGKGKDCNSFISAGRDFDGFMRDFVVCEYNEVAVLPDSVDDYHALCIENVGIAENIYDRLNLSAGQRVAVIGADFNGIITAQVLLYHKIIPIIIDNNPANLDRAKKYGIYYSFPADEELEANVMSATSGNLCDAVIYCATSRLPLSLASRLVGNGKTLILSCNSVISANLSANDILSKNLTVTGVSHSYGYTDAVINMLVHGAVNIDAFEREILTEYDPSAIFEENLVNPAVKRNKLTILKMII